MARRLVVIDDDPSLPSELARAARECEVMTTARALAEWIGVGRDLTASGVLKPAAAAEVCGLLGIELPTKKPRSALDISELMMVWSAAAAAGFIEITDRRVTAGAGLRKWLDGGPESTLATWSQCTLQSLGLAGAPDDADLDYLAVLCTLYGRDGTASLDELATGIEASSGVGGGPCPDCGQVHADAGGPLGFLELLSPVGDALERAEDAVLALAEFGVATLRGDVAELTLLGRWLTTVMFCDSAPAADVDAATFVNALAGLPPMVSALMARPWLEARTPVSAAGELLAFAESAGGAVRIYALALARQCGPEAAPAWRDWSDKPGFGSYARAWLAEQSGGELSDDDEAWMTVDTLASALDALPEGLSDVLLSAILQEQLADEVAEVLPAMAGSGHPAAERLVQLLDGTLGDRPSLSAGMLLGPVTSQPRKPRKSAPGGGQGKPTASGCAYQIKITLRGVSKPPIWRRVLVPAGIRLDQLHEVIQRAMGWGNYHMHVFTDGWREYGVPDRELGHENESAVALSALLVNVGDKLRYTYDFGDDWEHDIRLGKILSSDADTPYPVSTAGKGACPPEDCGGAWGYANLKAILADPADEEHQEMLDWLGLESAEDFDPAEFSVEEVNTRLRSIKS